jgi:RNA polymerase sigma factor for flagellar operon FliA
MATLAPSPPRPDAAQDAALWARYLGGADNTCRNALVTRYERLVRILAARAFSNRISPELEFDDYYQFGMLGLLQALDRFDPAAGVRFETFASRRVAGAILDGVVTLSEKQQQIATRQRAIKERAASVSEGSTPREDAFQRLANVAVGLALGFLLEDTGLYVSEERTYPDNSYSGIELRQLKKNVQAAVRQLPEQERRLVTLHYLQQHGFDEIGTQWSLTKGRISQIHRSALKRLRALLKPDGDGVEP